MRHRITCHTTPYPFLIDFVRFWSKSMGPCEEIRVESDPETACNRRSDQFRSFSSTLADLLLISPVRSQGIAHIQSFPMRDRRALSGTELVLQGSEVASPNNCIGRRLLFPAPEKARGPRKKHRQLSLTEAKAQRAVKESCCITSHKASHHVLDRAPNFSRNQKCWSN
jgi:hypothetical protein